MSIARQLAARKGEIEGLYFELAGRHPEGSAVSLALVLRDCEFGPPGNNCLWGAECTNRACTRDHTCQNPSNRQCPCPYEHTQRSTFFSCDDGAACDQSGCSATHPTRGNVPCYSMSATTDCNQPRCPYLHTSNDYKKAPNLPSNKYCSYGAKCSRADCHRVHLTPEQNSAFRKIIFTLNPRIGDGPVLKTGAPSIRSSECPARGSIVDPRSPAPRSPAVWASPSRRETREDSSSSSMDGSTSSQRRNPSAQSERVSEGKKLAVALILAMEGRGAELDSNVMEIIQIALRDTARARVMLTELLEEEDSRAIAAHLLG